jgi:hypothetical protein
VRSGVLWALRSRAAVEVLLSAGVPGLCEKRSGRGVFVDLMVRMHVCAMQGCEVDCWMSGRREEGRRKTGGREPQLRGALGGIVAVVVVDGGLQWRCWRVLLLEIFGMELGPPAHVKPRSLQG